MRDVWNIHTKNGNTSAAYGAEGKEVEIMGRIIGIDLGTTNSLAAVWQEGGSRLIPNSLGEYLTPSVVSFDDKGMVYVGKIAKERLISHPEQTASVFKRFMGTEKTYSLGGKSYRPEELSALVLRKLKEDAERYLGDKVDEAIISVPAYFNDMARKATKDAGALAGLHVERIINEPSAAARACRGWNQSSMQLADETLLVFDFGGGTLDVSLVDCFENVIEIAAVSGDNHLGGSDFDRVIAELFCSENLLVLDELPLKRQRVIFESAAKAKCALTKEEHTVMTVSDEGYHKQMELSSRKLIQSSMHLFHRMIVPVQSVLNDARKKTLEISKVALVGGSCKMPAVQQYLRRFLPESQMSVSNPDYVVALGVGIYAGIKERSEDIKDMLLTDICPFTLGTGVQNGADAANPIMAPIIERNSTLPCSRVQKFQTAGDFQKTVKIDVYQGEEYYVKDNICLGEMNVEVPIALKGQESVTVRYTYDINGLLIVDVKVDSTGRETSQIMMTGTNTITPKEMESLVKELERLKMPPAENEEFQMLFALGERLFAQSTGGLREEISRRLQYFQYLLDKEQDPYRIMKWKVNLQGFLESAGEYLDTMGFSWQQEDDDSWYQERKEDEESEEGYIRWYDGHLTS